MLATIRRRLTLAVMSVLFLAMLLPLNILPGTAFAQTKPVQCPQGKLCRLTIPSHSPSPQASSVALNPTQGPPGTNVTGTGSNWVSGDQMLVQWEDGTNLATTTVRSDGTFTVSFTIPTNATQGNHTVYFTDQTAGYFIPATFTVGTSTSSALTIQGLYTRDGNGNVTNTFAPGSAIQYVVNVYNSSGNSMTIMIHYEAFGPNNTYIYDQIYQNITIPQGASGWYTQGTVPTNAPSGTYTMQLHVFDQNNNNNKDAKDGGQFTVTASSNKVDKAIAWAKSQLGSSKWNGLCEKFVEIAYGTSGRYLTAQDAYNALHTSTNWSPDIGALVWFVPNKGNGGNGHVGIYLGNNQFISATYKGVKIEDMSYWSKNIARYEGWGDAPSSWPGR